MAESLHARAILAGTAALALWGCGPREPASAAGKERVLAPEVPSPPAPPPAPAPGVPPLERLQGDWVLVTIDDAPRERNAHFVHMRFTPGRISANSQCIPFRWRYGEEDGRLVIANERYPGPVCARPLSMWERRFQEGMNGAGSIAIAPDETLVVSGTAGTLRFQRE